MDNPTTPGEHCPNDLDRLLRNWLAERQQLLSLLCALSPMLREEPAPSELRPKLDRFCEILVDYVSAGHFEVYCELVEKGEKSGQLHGDAVTELYRRIVPTTAVALDFNDRHSEPRDSTTIARELSRLGQVLASRFDWEDALINLLHRADRAVA